MLHCYNYNYALGQVPARSSMRLQVVEGESIGIVLVASTFALFLTQSTAFVSVAMLAACQLARTWMQTLRQRSRL
jgi:hypothetical protein